MEAKQNKVFMLVAGSDKGRPILEYRQAPQAASFFSSRMWPLAMEVAQGRCCRGFKPILDIFVAVDFGQAFLSPQKTWFPMTAPSSFLSQERCHRFWSKGPNRRSTKSLGVSRHNALTPGKSGGGRSHRILKVRER
jgi:hypothetical protein